MVVLPCTHTLELRWDVDESTLELVDTSQQLCKRKRVDVYIVFGLIVTLNVQVS